jgi:hypothetical protein
MNSAEPSWQSLCQCQQSWILKATILKNIVYNYGTQLAGAS